MRAICEAVKGLPLESSPLAVESFSLSKLWLLMIAIISFTHWSETVTGSSMAMAWGMMTGSAGGVGGVGRMC